MRVLAVNGSPRKTWSTATLLESALAGAASRGAETELIHLYDLTYKGCVSCFACKLKGGKSYGRCACTDELAPLLDAVEEIDALILGSPIYFGAVSGEMRSFMERLLFPHLAYTAPPKSLFPRRIRVSCIYTMNMRSAEEMQARGVTHHLAANEQTLSMIFGQCEALHSVDTYQFSDYAKVVSDLFDVAQKARRREEDFPQDREKAFAMGARLVPERPREACAAPLTDATP